MWAHVSLGVLGSSWLEVGGEDGLRWGARLCPRPPALSEAACGPVLTAVGPGEGRGPQVLSEAAAARTERVCHGTSGKPVRGHLETAWEESTPESGPGATVGHAATGLPEPETRQGADSRQIASPEPPFMSVWLRCCLGSEPHEHFSLLCGCGPPHRHVGRAMEAGVPRLAVPLPPRGGQPPPGCALARRLRRNQTEAAYRFEKKQNESHGENPPVILVLR